MNILKKGILFLAFASIATLAILKFYWIDNYGFYNFGEHKGLHTETLRIYDEQGYNQAGYNLRGFFRNGIHYETLTVFAPDGFDKEGYNQLGFHRDGIHKETKNYYDYRGRDIYGYDRDGFDVYGFDKNGLDSDGVDLYGYDANGHFTGKDFYITYVPEEEYDDMVADDYIGASVDYLGNGIVMIDFELIEDNIVEETWSREFRIKEVEKGIYEGELLIINFINKTFTLEDKNYNHKRFNR